MLFRRSAAIALFFIAAVCALNACRTPATTFLAIIHVTVIDMTGAPPAPGQTVLIEKEKIVAVGPSGSLAIPSGAKVVDGAGKFLMPGLADMHIHLTGAGEPDGSRKFILPLLVANGITTVRDMGGYMESLVPLRKEIEEGKRIGPRIVFAGPYLDGEPPAFQPAMIVANREDADAAISWLKQRNVDFIKVQSNLSRDAYFAIADAAKKQNVSFVGHVPDRISAFEAADAGQRSIEHLTCELRACSLNEADLMHKQFQHPAKKLTPAQSKARELAWEREVLTKYSEEKAAALMTKFRAQQTWQTPTLILLQNDAFPSAKLDLTNDPRAKYVPAKFLETWRKNNDEQMKHVSAEEFALRAGLLGKSLGLVGLMRKNHVKLLAGTDSTAPYVFPGSSLHEELALLVKAGLTPMEALKAATRNPAEFLGRLDLQGTITVGKNADLLLLDANPLDEIHNTQRISAVVLRGKLLERKQLDTMLGAVEEFSARH